MELLKAKLNSLDQFLYGLELVSTRGSVFESRAVQIRRFADTLSQCDRLDWISITENAGGNPMLAPSALGKPILYAGKEVIIHLSCKDNNRNGLESTAWHLASEGFHNILALSGDYPVDGNDGRAKPVFDIDSVGLISMLQKMNRGMAIAAGPDQYRRLNKTSFFIGAVVSNFKRYENEVIPQYMKLQKKVECGAQFVINQIGYDSRKIHELKVYMDRNNIGHIPVIGNVFVLSPSVAELFHANKIPGVVVSNELLALCKKQARSSDRGKGFFLELAAKQSAIYRGLGYQGSYLGGIHHYRDLERFFEIEDSFGSEDWKGFSREIRFSRPDEFYLMAEDAQTGLSDPERLNSVYETSLKKHRTMRNVALGYKLSKAVHNLMFTPGKAGSRLGFHLCHHSKDPSQGPKILRLAEHASKSLLFRCQDCGDCSLPEIAYLCPESQCAKNQRNGPCGGTREGKCEVGEFECIWCRAYDRMKHDGREMELLSHAPVVQDQSLRGTSSWANTWLGRDHISKRYASRRKRGQSVQNVDLIQTVVRRPMTNRNSHNEEAEKLCPPTRR